jgi:plasmid stability protein
MGIGWRQCLCYCEIMKNITVTVDDDTYRRARVRAAELDTSVSAEVKQFLEQFARKETEFERLLAREKQLRKEISGISASDRLSRDELYDRAARRREAEGA